VLVISARWLYRLEKRTSKMTSRNLLEGLPILEGDGAYYFTQLPEPSDLKTPLIAGVLTKKILEDDAKYDLGAPYFLRQFIGDLVSGDIIMANLDKRLACVARTEGLDVQGVKNALLEELIFNSEFRDGISAATPMVREALRLDFALAS